MAELPTARSFHKKSDREFECVFTKSVVLDVVVVVICLVSCQVIIRDIIEMKMLPITAYFHTGEASIRTDIEELGVSYVTQVLSKMATSISV